jgi:glycosyltransferase involved in cell wall biosynthesis
MKLAMTLMVRDEADIIEAMIKFHLDQGIDILIVTDNGSVDGTVEILERFEHDGLVDLRHDPVQHKQQGETVTKMARAAYDIHGADWVLNADADEFWAAVNPDASLRDVFAGIDPALQSFTVPVFDMIGAPAMNGTGLQRLRFRDLRSQASLNAVGLLAHSTHDAVHVGSPIVVVAQGNHFVSLPSFGSPDPAHQIEVRHYPWRSWSQYSRKVESAGRAYESQTVLKPSPNHHGMRDYNRLRDGSLLAHYLIRHPTDHELRLGLANGEYAEDLRMSNLIASPVADSQIDDAVESTQRAFLHTFQNLEKEFEAALKSVAHLEQELDLSSKLLELSVEREDILRAELGLEKNRRIVRALDFAIATLRRVAQRP